MGMSYAKLKHIGGRDTAELNNAGLPVSDLKYEAQDLQDATVLEAVAGSELDGSGVECKELSMISACIRDRIHKENMAQYAKLKDVRRHETRNLHFAALPYLPAPIVEL